MSETNRNLLLLKIFVYSMGLVLIGGFIYIGTSIYEDMEKRNKNNPSDVANVIVNQEERSCEGGNLEVVLGLDIQSVDLENNKLIIMTAATRNDPQKIMVIDYCNQKVISEITVK